MNRSIKRFLPLTIILVGMAVIYFTGAYKYLSFEALKANHKLLKTFIAHHPVFVPFLFIVSYIIFSATCGATLIFLAARTALGDILRNKAGPFLRKMESGFQKNAASYLLFLRFVPLFPFWVVNLAPAFFGVSLRTFVWTTVVGIAPGSLIFTLAGGGLEKISMIPE